MKNRTIWLRMVSLVVLLVFTITAAVPQPAHAAEAGDGVDAIQKWNTVSELDAWITYEAWGYRLPDTTDMVTVNEKFKVYRGTPIAITNSTDQRETAEAFLQFLLTPEVHEIFIKWRWR